MNDEERIERRTEPEDTRDDLLWERAVNAALSRLYKPLISPASSLEEIARIVLDEARGLTGSGHGYVSTIDPVSGDNVSHTLTDMLSTQCLVVKPQRKITFPRQPDGTYAGLWGHALNTRRAFFTNDPASHAASSGLPDGHLPIQRFLSMPVLLGEELVGQIALANSLRDYEDRDLEAVSRLAEMYALAILRVRTESSLRESERKHRQVVENLNEGIWVIDKDSNTTFVNSRMAEMLGYTKEEMQGRHLFAFMDERGTQICQRNLERRRRGISEDHEFELLRKDGSRVYTIMQSSPFHDADGNYTGALAGVLDITERKRTEDALRQEQDFVSAVFATAGALVVVLNRDGGIVRFNRACELLTGYSFEEVRGKLLSELLLVPEESAQVKEVFLELTAGQFPNRYENYWVTRDGSRRRISWSNTALLKGDGSVEFVIGTGVDISELREVEEQLRALNERLERTVAERTAVAEQRASQLRAMSVELTKAEQRERRRLAGVLHDHVQQLLVGARYRISALKGRSRDSADKETMRELDELLGQAIEAGRSLTFDLSLPSLEEEGLPGGLRLLARRMEETHGLTVRVTVEDGVELGDQALGLLLFEAVRELLFNVIKHAGVREARVVLGPLEPGRLQITVEDDGVGFAAEDFEGGGSSPGFGLSSLRERIDLVGGQMDVRSTPGRGTRVHLTTPPTETG